MQMEDTCISETSEQKSPETLSGMDDRHTESSGDNKETCGVESAGTLWGELPDSTEKISSVETTGMLWGELPDSTEKISGVETAGTLWGELPDSTEKISGVETAGTLWGELPDSTEKISRLRLDDVEEAQHTDSYPSTDATIGSDLFSVMIDRLAKSDAHFKHQQRDEPDLGYEEKSDIARKLYEDKPDLFLARFGKYLAEKDLQLFNHLKSDYSVQFYISEVKRLLDSRRTKTHVKNRRYQAMLKIMSEGSYFSDEEMKERDPLLYEQMVGQFITEEEANEEVERQMDRTDLRFSTILMKHMQWQQSNHIYAAQKDIEEGQVEESDDDDDGDGDDDENRMEKEHAVDGSKWVPSESERQLMRQEFLHTMQERFMSGKDHCFFDYSTVDENAEYDNLDIQEHDEEDKYFAEESPEELAEDMDCTETDDADFKLPVRKNNSENQGNTKATASQPLVGPS